MAETSYFWEGKVTGDAANAEYDHLEFTKVYNKLFASDGAGYVSPGYGNSLNVQASSPAAATIDVATGAALVQGFLYENTTLNTLSIAANASGNPRIDRVVLRISFAAQTIRLVVIQGTPAAAPSLPSLTQAYGTTWEVSLAYIWVANGFGTITDSEIHDEREFMLSPFVDQGEGSRINVLRGSEFIVPCVSTANTGLDVSGVWRSIQTSATITFVTKPSQQSRGFGVKVLSGASADEITQTVNVTELTTYTLNSLIMPEAGAAGMTIELYDVSNGASLLSRSIRRVGSWITEKMRVTTPAGCVLMALRITGIANQSIDIGQQIITQGYTAGKFQPVHEYIPLGRQQVGTNFNFTPYSTSINTIDLFTGAWNATFGTLASRVEILALDLLIGANDSGSAAGTPEVIAYGISEAAATHGVRIDLSGVPNDNKRYTNGIIRLLGLSGLPTIGTYLQSFKISVAASGAGTCDVLVAIRGVWV